MVLYHLVVTVQLNLHFQPQFSQCPTLYWASKCAIGLPTLVSSVMIHLYLEKIFSRLFFCQSSTASSNMKTFLQLE